MLARALAFALLVAAAPSLADGGQSAKQPKPAKPVQGSKMMCRTEPDLGTRLGHSRACHTQAEWEDLRRQTKANIEHIENARVWNSGG